MTAMRGSNTFSTSVMKWLSINRVSAYTITHSLLINQDKVAMAVILFGFLLRIPFVFTGIGTLSHPWRPADTASIAHNFLVNGFQIFYPQINWGGAGPGYVETEFQLYPFVVALLYKVLGEYFWIGRAVSLAVTALTCIVFYRLALRMFNKTVAVFALAFFVLSPLYFRYSIEFMPDATVMFFYITSISCFLWWLKTKHNSTLLLTSVFTAFAILVKPTSIHIGFLFFFLLIQRYGWRAFTMPKIWIFGISSLLPGALWYIHARDLFLTYGSTFGVISGGDSKFGNILAYWTSLKYYGDLFDILVNRALTAPGAAIFLAGTFIYLRNRSQSVFLFGLIAYLIYCLIIPRYITIAEYYNIYFVTYAAFGFGVGGAWIFEKFRMATRSSRLLIYKRAVLQVTVIGLLLLFSRIMFGYFRDFSSVHDEPQIVCAIQARTLIPSSAKVIVSTTSSTLDEGVPNNYQEPTIFYVGNFTGWSLAADQHTPQQVEQYRTEGATYLIMFSRELVQASSQLMISLERNTSQIGPGIERGCAVYQLNKSLVSGAPR